MHHRKTLNSLKEAVGLGSLKAVCAHLYSIGDCLNSCNDGLCRKIIADAAFLYPSLAKIFVLPRNAVDVIRVSGDVHRTILTEHGHEDGIWECIGDALMELNVAYINRLGCSCGKKVSLMFGSAHRNHKVVKEWLGKHFFNQDQRDHAFMMLCGKVNGHIARTPLDLFRVSDASSSNVAIITKKANF